MKIIKILLFFIFFSCNKFEEKDDSLDKFLILAKKEWIYAFEVNSSLNSDNFIEKPPGVEQLVLNLKVPNSLNSKLSTYCIYYLTPFKNILGKMTLVHLKENKKCDDSYDPSLVELTIDKIKQFKFIKLNQDLTFNINLIKTKINFSLHLQNLSQELIYEKFKAPYKNKKIKGLTYLKKIEKFNNENNYLGKLSDRFQNNTAIRCLQINKNCEQVGENRCNECRYGFYSVVDYNCKSGSMKFCGQNHCGEKNEPACSRGFEYAEDLTEEEFGICEADLTPVYNSDHILVCQ